jgi:drug/metabolite transporter (DMT)-like permease
MTLAGSSVVVGKLLSVRVPVFLSVELTMCFALLVLVPLQAFRVSSLLRLRFTDLRSMFLQALFGMVLFRGLTLTGLTMTSAGSAGLITSTAPAVMAVLAAAIFRERLGVRGMLGVLLCVGGLLLVNVAGLAGSHRHGLLVGNLLVLAATLCEALLTIFRKASGGRVDSVTNTTMLVAFSAIMLLPFALHDLVTFRLASIDLVGWAALTYYGAVATVIAYILWGDGAVRIPANATGIATAAMPVSAVLLSALILGERPGPQGLAGCALVVGGIIIGAARAGRQTARAKTPALDREGGGG